MHSLESTLMDKANCVLKERRIQYGSPLASFTTIAQRWSQVLGIPISPEQAIRRMIEVKRARLDYNPHHEDSQIDIIGYQRCLDEICNLQKQCA